MPTDRVAEATVLSLAELDRLLALRPGPAADLARSALGVPAAAEPDDSLPHGPAAVVGDTLTSAVALISIGTADARAALLAVGLARVLVLAPDGADCVEVAALDAATAVGAATAAIADRVGDAAVVLLAVPGGDIHDIPIGDGLAARVEELLP